MGLSQPFAWSYSDQPYLEERSLLCLVGMVPFLVSGFKSKKFAIVDLIAFFMIYSYFVGYFFVNTFIYIKVDEPVLLFALITLSAIPTCLIFITFIFPALKQGAVSGNGFFLIPLAFLSLNFFFTNYSFFYIHYINYAHALASWTELIQMASIGGVYVVIFLIVLTNVLLAKLFCVAWEAKPLYAAALVLLCISVYQFGLYQISNHDSSEKKTISVALVQTDKIISRMQTNDGKGKLALLEKLERQAKTYKPDLIMFPESVYKGEFNLGQKHVKVLGAWGIPMLFGTKAKEFSQEGRKKRVLAVNIDGQGKVLNSYIKRELTPFGERYPWPFNYFWYRALLPGTGPTSQRIQLANGKNITGCTSVCFESSFPYHCLNADNDNTEILFNLSSDDWLGESSGPHFTLRTNIFRAIEMGKTLLRVSDSGVTAHIDPVGRVVHKTNLYTSGVLLAKAILNKEQTFFYKYGHTLVWLISWLYVFYLLWLGKQFFTKLLPAKWKR